MSAFGLTRSTELTLAESEDFVAEYFAKFPGVKRYLDNIRSVAAQQGYVETLLGRRRYFPALQNPADKRGRNNAERAAINAPIQGTAADIMKIAMLKVQSKISDLESTDLLLQIHDEIIVQTPIANIEEVTNIISTEMESATQLKVPLFVNIKNNKNLANN